MMFKGTTWRTLLIGAGVLAVAASASPAAQQPQAQQPAFNEWVDSFEGSDLDMQRWERVTFEGASGGSLKVEGGELRMRGMVNSRSGVRSRQMFKGERFIAEATLAKVTNRIPERGQPDTGFAILTVMFGGSHLNRIEWLLRSDGIFEAWLIREGRPGERLDDKRLATKERKPTIAIVRRGEDFMFVLNGEIGLQKTIRDMPQEFKVMVYGFGSTDNNWDAVRVVTTK